MSQLAMGEVGLIISEATYFRKEGHVRPWQLGIYDDSYIPGLRALSRAVHGHGTPIVLQLNHAGLFADFKVTGQVCLAPSKVEDLSSNPHKQMDIEDIREIVEGFGQAARRAKEAHFDGVQIHAAHGYLINQFLSPVFNRRQDAYGGSLENRARFLLEVLKSIRANVGNDFPILVKLNCQDFIKGGLTLDDSSNVGILLQKGGIDAIELSGGMASSGKLSQFRTKIRSEEDEAYFRQEAKYFKKRLHLPLILVGGIRSFHVAEHLLEKGYADYISISRPFIREPFLIRRWKSGDLRKATCISDNRCFEPILAGEGIYCVIEKKTREKTV
jgi:2,4-dienoyl-CoA reductase-like NADH-dependent reductase (Old Yellow Enzyme family)